MGKHSAGAFRVVAEGGDGDNMCYKQAGFVEVEEGVPWASECPIACMVHRLVVVVVPSCEEEAPSAAVEVGAACLVAAAAAAEQLEDEADTVSAVEDDPEVVAEA